MSSYSGIGCMSGSSLDGLDVCFAEYTGDKDTDIWGYRILKAETYPYPSEWGDKLRNASKLVGESLIKLHMEYGKFIGKTVLKFLENNEIPASSVDFVASHGHTVFHNPKEGYTFQLGDGETTSSYLSWPFVCNFRTKDVALGGQGAPLVPVGEKYLFNPHDICINLGGIANIGLKSGGGIGEDVCPCNYVTNRLAKQYNNDLEFDKDGKIAAQGNVIQEIYDKLEALPFYQEGPPKSLGPDWINTNIIPLLNTKTHSIPNLMRTFVEHVANRISTSCSDNHVRMRKHDRYHSETANVLVTGGGAFNKTLMELLRQKLKENKMEIEEADSDTINFKEALIFGFLGLRCLLGEENIYSGITGSRSNSVSGSIHRPLLSGSTPTKFEKFFFQLRRQRSLSMNYYDED